MLLVIVGLACFVTSASGYIPPWSPSCPQQSVVSNACVYGNLQVTLFSKSLYPKDCNSHVQISEFTHTPVIHINSTNTTDRFTVMMVDVGWEGKGPYFLEWMVTNVTKQSLPLYNTIPNGDVIEKYNPPLLMEYFNHRTLVQILVFRHHNVLRVPFGELWVKQTRDFSLRTLISNTNPNLRLCGPVAGAQYWLYDPSYMPSAPPSSPQDVLSVQPVYVPVVPVPAAPGQHPSTHTSFPKRSSATVFQPVQMLFIPLVVLTVIRL